MQSPEQLQVNPKSKTPPPLDDIKTTSTNMQKPPYIGQGQKYQTSTIYSGNPLSKRNRQITKEIFNSGSDQELGGVVSANMQDSPIIYDIRQNEMRGSSSTSDDYVICNIDNIEDMLAKDVDDLNEYSSRVSLEARQQAALYQGLSTGFQILIIVLGFIIAILSEMMPDPQKNAYTHSIAGLGALTSATQGANSTFKFEKRSNYLYNVFSEAWKISRKTKNLKYLSASGEEIQSRVDEYYDELTDLEIRIYNSNMMDNKSVQNKVVQISRRPDKTGVGSGRMTGYTDQLKVKSESNLVNQNKPLVNNTQNKQETIYDI